MKRKTLFYIGLLLILVLVAAVISLLVYSHRQTSHSQPAATKSISTAQVPQAKPAQTISHIFIIMDENETAASIIGNPSAPYINSLAQKYALATNYSAVTHPSLPNYLAITSGSTDGISTDCNPPSAGCEVNVKNIADEIEASGRTWKEYAESMPSNCYTYNAGEYATKHNPFVYYTDIVSNATRCNSHVVPFTQLSSDLSSISTTPNYAFITPNLCNDMHDCGISAGDSWLSKYVPMILNSKAFITQKSLLIITWDEGTLANNSVATIFAGNAAKSSFKSTAAFNHYSILHTIEYLWGLSPLTNNDSQAPVMTNLLN